MLLALQSLLSYYATVLSSNTAYDKLLLNPRLLRLSHLKYTQNKLVKAYSFAVFPGELANLFTSETSLWQAVKLELK